MFLKLSFTFLLIGRASNPPFNQFVALVPGMIWDCPLASCSLPEVSLQRFVYLVRAEQFDLSKPSIIYHIIKETTIGSDQGRTGTEGIPLIHSLGCDFFWPREVSAAVAWKASVGWPPQPHESCGWGGGGCPKQLNSELVWVTLHGAGRPRELRWCLTWVSSSVGITQHCSTDFWTTVHVIIWGASFRLPGNTQVWCNLCNFTPLLSSQTENVRSFFFFFFW